MDNKQDYVDLGFAKLDVLRMQRIQQEEVIFGAGKTKEQILAITEAILSRQDSVLITKISKNKAIYLQDKLSLLQFDESANIAWCATKKKREKKGTLAVITAGTSDIPIAREAIITAQYFGIEVKEYLDVGVASLARVASILPELTKVQTLIVVAGMEGTLPVLLGSLVSQPIIAVPTSVGYGTARKGEVALHTALNACVPGITVVNIDNGFGAAMAALRIHNHNSSLYN